MILQGDASLESQMYPFDCSKGSIGGSMNHIILSLVLTCMQKDR